MTGFATRWGVLLVLLWWSLDTATADTNGVSVVESNRVIATSFPQTPNDPPVLVPPVADARLPVLRVLGALALVLGVFLVGVWCFKNWHRFMVRGGKAPRLNVIEVRSLGGRHALYLVGCYDQRLLVAASPTGVRLLTQLPDGEESPDLANAPISFSESLEQASNQTP